MRTLKPLLATVVVTGALGAGGAAIANAATSTTSSTASSGTSTTKTTTPAAPRTTMPSGRNCPNMQQRPSPSACLRRHAFGQPHSADPA